MRRLTKALTLICFLSACSVSYGQVHLTMTNLINFPDTVTPGMNVPVTAIVQNTGNLTFQGSVQVALMTNPAGAITYLYFSNNSVILFPNDTVSLVDTSGFTFDSTVFRAGNNVVVVWPYTTQGVAVDSFTTSTYMDTSTVTGIKSVAFEDLVIYPVPASKELIAQHTDGVEYVRILTLLGTEWMHQTVTDDIHQLRLNLEGMLPGMYLLELTDRMNRVRTIRFIRE